MGGGKRQKFLQARPFCVSGTGRESCGLAAGGLSPSSQPSKGSAPLVSSKESWAAVAGLEAMAQNGAVLGLGFGGCSWHGDVLCAGPAHCPGTMLMEKVPAVGMVVNCGFSRGCEMADVPRGCLGRGPCLSPTMPFHCREWS